MMKYDRTRPANVTMPPVASYAIVPAALVAPGAARPGRSADWAVTELYSLLARTATVGRTASSPGFLSCGFSRGCMTGTSS